MILGRSTVQWTALITATLSFVQIILPLVLPDLADEAAIVLPALGVLLAGYIAFLANTQTTPISDPILPAGTQVKIEGTEATQTIEIPG